jgi:hypothetical protein
MDAGNQWQSRESGLVVPSPAVLTHAKKIARRHSGEDVNVMSADEDFAGRLGLKSPTSLAFYHPQMKALFLTHRHDWANDEDTLNRVVTHETGHHLTQPIDSRHRGLLVQAYGGSEDPGYRQGAREGIADRFLENRTDMKGNAGYMSREGSFQLGYRTGHHYGEGI